MGSSLRKYYSKSEIFILLSILLIPLTIKADGGYIPLIDVNVWAPGQKAVIAWNGTREILILSLDVYADSDSKVLKIIPLPSYPIRIEEGDTEIFEELNEFLYEYARSITAYTETGAFIVLYKVIGPHNITVIEANSVEDFINWAEEYLLINGIEYSISSPRVEEVITKYIEDGIRYFVFDLIDLSSVPQNIKPIIYEFESDKLFYPLEISSLAQGPVNIVLYLLTETPLNQDDLPNWMNYGHHRIGEIRIYETVTSATTTYIYTAATHPLYRAMQFKLDREELETLFSDTNEATRKTIQLFEGGAWLTVLSFEGVLESLRGDLKLQTLDTWSTVTTIRTKTLTEYYFSYTFIPTVLGSSITGTTTFNYTLDYPIYTVMTVSLPQTISNTTQITIPTWLVTYHDFEFDFEALPVTLTLSNTTISEWTLYYPWMYYIPAATTSTETRTSTYGEVLAIAEFYNPTSIVVVMLLITFGLIYHRKKTTRFEP
jgi:hypothetical protein